MKIIYKNVEGVLIVIHPTPEGLEQFTIEELAAKDVPTGLAFAIVEDSMLPTDRLFRGAWTCSDELLNDGVGV